MCGRCATDADAPLPAPVDERMAERRALLWAAAIGAALLAAVAAEWAGAYDAIAGAVPASVGVMVTVAAVARPALRVAREALHLRLRAHSLPLLGVLGALLAGEWPAALGMAALVHLADRVEGSTGERSRVAGERLRQLAPERARLENAAGVVRTVPVVDVRPGDVVHVLPGERVPVDGIVLEGYASLDRSETNGEHAPADVGPGDTVSASAAVLHGALRVSTLRSGSERSVARSATLAAVARAGPTQRAADRTAAWMVPLVLCCAAAAGLFHGRAEPAVAVLAVACGCSFALAVPAALSAAAACAARAGVRLQHPPALETLARADVLLVDKTGTLTTGVPELTDVVALAGYDADEVMVLAAAVEAGSDHPLAAAICQGACRRGLAVPGAEAFARHPGRGVSARVAGARVEVVDASRSTDPAVLRATAEIGAGATAILLVIRDGAPIGILAAADPVRGDVAEALRELGTLGFHTVEILTGDSSPHAAAVGAALGARVRAGLLPDAKVAAIREYQRAGRTVVMVGDGTNDTAALLAADVGIAMGAVGTALARDAADVVLLREEWSQVPAVVRMARRVVSTIRWNLAGSVVYNGIGITLAAAGVLSPVAAAAIHSLPDLVVLFSSARLLRPTGTGVARRFSFRLPGTRSRVPTGWAT
ncbi:MAG TPA: heavy metal translocating P-type ATPase [Longimicrobium sp.]|nr:heavy metal translocating P-type ATPase [Longimicrobium sp.]